MNKEAIEQRREAVEYKIAEIGAKATVKTLRAADRVLATKAGRMALCVPLALSCIGAMTVCAAEGNAEQLVSGVFETVKKWVSIIGGICIVFGGIKFGMAIKDDDEPGRGRALLTIAGGAVVTGIATFVQMPS